MGVRIPIIPPPPPRNLHAWVACVALVASVITVAEVTVDQRGAISEAGGVSVWDQLDIIDADCLCVPGFGLGFLGKPAKKPKRNGLRMEICG